MSIINILIILAGIIISIVILVGVICRLVGVEPGEIDKAIFIVQKNIYKKYFLR